MSSHVSKIASPRRAEGTLTALSASAAGQRMASLRAAWLAHTLKRAMAAVGSASDADYRAFGWDRAELLVQLHWLVDETGREQPNRQVPLAVRLSRPARSKGVEGKQQPKRQPRSIPFLENQPCDS